MGVSQKGLVSRRDEPQLAPGVPADTAGDDNTVLTVPILSSRVLWKRDFTGKSGNCGVCPTPLPPTPHHRSPFPATPPPYRKLVVTPHSTGFTVSPQETLWVTTYISMLTRLCATTPGVLAAFLMCR